MCRLRNGLLVWGVLWVINPGVMPLLAQEVAPPTETSPGAEPEARSEPAQDPDTEPAGAPTPDEPLTVVITGVQGIVQYRESSDQGWKKAQVEVMLGPGAEFRTGPRSAVQFSVGDTQVVTLDRLGTMKVINAIQLAGTKVKTDLGMKYGRTRYDVEQAGIEHESTIHSPSATLAIRGTSVGYEDTAPFVPEAWSLVGRAQYQNYRRQFLAFGGRRTVSIRADEESAASTSLEDSKVDPSDPRARTESEEDLLAVLPALGGNDLNTFGIDALRRRVTGGDLKSNQTVISALQFSLTWTGTADLNLWVRSPLLEDVCTAPDTGPFGSTCLTGVGSGGTAGADVLSPGGNEIIFWRDTFPTGTFFYGLENISGSEPANFQIDVTNFGDPVGQRFTGVSSTVGDIQIRTATP